MTNNIDHHPGGRHWTAARERLLLLTLAAIQFTSMLDFMIIIPLGTKYQELFHITAAQFQWIVGAYGLSAGLAGLAGGFFLDWFDRKQALIWVYSGFALGTLFCALAPTYHLLVAARLVAGAFGGVCGTIILSIVGDVIPMERRGAAMGKIMSAFSVASIVGVPTGLYVAAYFGANMPFYAIAGLSVIFVVIAAIITPPLRGHLEHASDEHPVARTWAVMSHPDHLKAYAFMAMLTFAGFLIFPSMPYYMEKNVGLTRLQIPLIYVCGGLCTVFSMNWVGRWADRSGKLKVFNWTTLSVAVPVLLLTNLPHVPVAVALSVTTLLMICMSSRMVPAMALMTGAVEARYRGGFMSINSAVQQFSIFLSTLVGAMLIGQGPKDELTNYPICGVISIVCAYICIYLACFLKMPVKGERPAEPLVVEAM